MLPRLNGECFSAAENKIGHVSAWARGHPRQQSMVRMVGALPGRAGREWGAKQHRRVSGALLASKDSWGRAGQQICPWRIQLPSV